MDWVSNPSQWLVHRPTQAFYLVGIVANIASVALLSLWQTVAIVKPLAFLNLASKGRVCWSVVVTWIWALVMAVLRVTSDEVKYDAVKR